MKGIKYKIRITLVMAVWVWITIMSSAPVISKDKPDLKSKALQSLSEELNVPQDRLEMRGQEVKRLEYLGLDLYIFKILNLEALERGDDRLIFVTLDAEGRRVNLDELNALNIAAKKAKYGKLEPALYDLLQFLGPDETVDVSVWLTLDVEPRPRYSEEEMKVKGGWDVIEEEDRARRRRNTEAIKKFAESIVREIETSGGKVLYIDELVPIVDARLTKTQIEAIAKRDDVRKIHKIPKGKGPSLNISSKAVRAPYAWGLGYTGSNQLIAIIETGGIDFGNPHLQGENRLGSCISMSGYHATQVAGVAASAYETYKGVAPGSRLAGGEACTFDLETGIKLATIWAMNKGARVLNNSWGGNTLGYSDNDSKYHDRIVTEEGVTVVDAAGNCTDPFLGTDCSTYCNVDSPGIAYNAITVGGFDDHNKETWDDDTIDTCSSYLDPIQGPAKPELVAPSMNIKTTDHYTSDNGYFTPRNGVSGTSFAAPHVSAAAALLMERSSTLKNWPEAVKAILMSSAIHNIYMFTDFSDRDGAGALSIDQAIKVAGRSNPNGWESRILYKTDLDNHNEVRYTFNATQDQRVRVVIVWSVNVLYSEYPDSPGVGLHYHILDPIGRYIEVNSERNNNFMWYEFIATKTGTYSIVIHDPIAFNDTSTNLAVAWSVSNKDGYKVINDTDGDGMYDNYEVAYGLDPNDPKDVSSVGSDLDGLTNLTEYYMGTNPKLYDAIYTDVPLKSGDTFIRARHIYELRNAITAVRQSASLTRPAWTDPDLTGSVIKVVHIQELRNYLTPALQARGFSVPIWTDASLSGKVIKSAHLNEIRNAVK